jgi:hypothetical protein
MDRRAILGMSFAELVMVRIGHAVGALCLLFLLPVLPFVALATTVSAVLRPDAETPEPTYRPDWAE